MEGLRTNVSPLPSRVEILGIAFLMVAAAFVAFGAAVSYGFLNFDDPYVIVNNLAIRGPTFAHIKTAFTTYDPELYIPMTLLSYQLNWLIGGLDASLYHLTNIVLHGLNAFLFSGIIWLILGRKTPAIFFGLLFAVHPLNTEAAVWASARKDVLSTFFALGSILCYLRYTETHQRKMVLLSVGLFLFAALSKSSVMVLPLLLPLLRFLKEGKMQPWKTYAKELWPFFLLSFATGIVALQGKERVVGALSMTETALLAIKSTVFYLQKIIVPYHLSAVYPQTDVITLGSPDIFVSVAVLAILLVASIAFFTKTSWPAVCLLLFIVSIAPSFLNAHKGTQTFFAVDRYAYIGMMWILLLFAAVSSELTTRLTRTQNRILAAGILLGLSFLSRMQTTLWQSDILLFEHALALYPASVSARTGLGAAYTASGRMDKELAVLQEGLTYSSDIALSLGIGSVYARQGRVEEAEALYMKSMAASPKNPEPHFYLATLYEQQGKTQSAVIEYTKAIALDSSYTAAYNNLGAIAMDAGDYPEAEKQFKAALSWNSNFFEGQYNLFQVLEFQKKTDEAFPHLEAAYLLRDDIPDAGLSYGYRLHERGRDDEAIIVLRHVLTVDPTNRTANRLLNQLIETEATPSETTSTELQRRDLRQQQRINAL